MNLLFKNYWLLICLSCLICSCSNFKKQAIDEEQSNKADIQYASGFSIEYFDDYTLVKVRNPWAENEVLHQYVLIEREKPQPESLPKGTIVKIPVNNIACLSSVDAGVIKMLGDSDKIKAIADVHYVKMPFLQAGLKNGEIINIGESTSLNMERLISVSPDIIIVAPFQNTGYGKLETTGISIVECASYMENTPLGRAEWIRFIAAFLKKGKEAEDIMDGIAARYLSVCEKVKAASSKPKVFSEIKHGSSWDIPGGKSYMAQFYHDAGADYIWKNDTTKGSVSLPYELVYEKAEDADFWIIKTDKDLTYSDIKKEYEPYSYFRAWREKNIILSNTIKNDYYEDGTMNPDYILEDLASLFHPELFEGYKQRYFKLIEDE